MFIWSTVAVTLLHEGMGLCLCPNVISVVFCCSVWPHGLCVPAAERAGTEAVSELVTVPQWALVCGRYVLCAHMNGCMYVCTYVRGLVLRVPAGTWKRLSEQSWSPNKCVYVCVRCG